MEGFSPNRIVTDLICQYIKKFTLIDIGCSGGIDNEWRMLGENLNAFCFDTNIINCLQLAKIEDNPRVIYKPALIEISKEHPFALKRGESPNITRNPWNRLAVNTTIKNKQSEIAKMSAQDKTAMNLWEYVDHADERIQLPKFFLENNIEDIDFIKIDIDGSDFDILNSIENEFDRTSVLGIAMEVNFVGDDTDTAHTFHNTDRFMRSHGYDLFNLTVRKYSASALPSRYLYNIPAQSEFGMPLQGDAIYIRDICASHNKPFANNLSPEKLLKIALIYSMIGLPDFAAESLNVFRNSVSELCDVTPILNALVEQANPDCGLTYDQYIEAFNRNDPIFWPQ